jgi:hypothetical protein
VVCGAAWTAQDGSARLRMAQHGSARLSMDGSMCGAAWTAQERRHHRLTREVGLQQRERLLTARGEGSAAAKSQSRTLVCGSQGTDQAARGQGKDPRRCHWQPGRSARLSPPAASSPAEGQDLHQPAARGHDGAVAAQRHAQPQRAVGLLAVHLRREGRRGSREAFAGWLRRSAARRTRLGTWHWPAAQRRTRALGPHTAHHRTWQYMHGTSHAFAAIAPAHGPSLNTRDPPLSPRSVATSPGHLAHPLFHAASSTPLSSSQPLAFLPSSPGRWPGPPPPRPTPAGPCPCTAAAPAGASGPPPARL